MTQLCRDFLVLLPKLWVVASKALRIEQSIFFISYEDLFGNKVVIPSVKDAIMIVYCWANKMELNPEFKFMIRAKHDRNRKTILFAFNRLNEDNGGGLCDWEILTFLPGTLLKGLRSILLDLSNSTDLIIFTIRGNQKSNRFTQIYPFMEVSLTTQRLLFRIRK